MRWIEGREKTIHMPRLIVVGQMLHRLRGVVQMRCAGVIVAIIIVMVQHVNGVFCHVFDD